MNPFHRNFYLAGLLVFLAAQNAALGFEARDANTVSSAFNSAFYVQSGTNGWFKNTQTGGVTYFWGQAEMIECVIDAYEWTSNANYQAQITNLLNGFLYNNGTVWTSYTDYNDDVMWAVLAFARGGVDTGKSNYCALAKSNFDACYARAYDTNLGGGLYWEYPTNASKNACVNGPAAIAAYLLYQIYGDTNYWNKATNLYDWERATLFNANSGAIADNIGTNGVVNGGATTYNQGTFLGAAHFLGQTNDAALAANFTMENMTTGPILPEYGIANNNSGFNAIFLRWLVRFMRDRNLGNIYEPWLQTNAAAAWSVRRGCDSLSWCQWLSPSPEGTNFYAWDCISSYEALQAANPTQGAAAQAVPEYPCGYYTLDDGSGAVAADSTGGGNNGVVSNATWSTNGRFNGCLTFNGSNSFVQITNLVGNDFSISFWVKTTQTAGTGEWYYGAGLVDGDYPGVANDFGTAMVGGKFCFGVGNPDTTISSTVSINNGAWHHCVATRQQATGAMNVYVDGSLQGTGAGNRNTLNASAKLLFGAIASGGGYLSGSLDDVRIFSRTLGSNEVAALYSNAIAPPTLGPTNLVAVASNAQVQLSWSDASLATSYNVKRALVSGGPYTNITNISAAAFTDVNVTNNHTYYYVVSPVDMMGEGLNSAEAGATPWSLLAWFKADAITNVSNGAGVSVWPDSSGNGFTALQPVPAFQPKFVTAAINGLPAVQFNSSATNYLWFFRPVQDDFTIIFVFQSSQGVGTSTAFYSGAGLVNGEVTGTVNDFGTSLNANGQILVGTGNPDTSIYSGTGYNKGVPHLVTFKRTRSSGALALYVDGNLVATGTGGTQSLTSPNQLVLGAQQTLLDFLTGDIAEVQIYNTPLSDTDREGYERALKCKYGLSGAEAPLAPSGLTLAAGNREISLRWTMVTGAATYNVWRSTNSGASYQLVASGLTGGSYVDTNAANGQINYYEVTGSNACGAGAVSASAGILLPLPTVSASSSAGTLALNWPGWASDWKLYFTTNLTAPITWAVVTNTASNSNGQFHLSLPEGAPASFYRLSAP
jgi:hypothetical protein